MAEAKPFSPVKLICGIIASEDAHFKAAGREMEALYGPVDGRSPCQAFDLTDYYEKQMGRGLRREFLSFERLIRPEALSGIKLRTNRLEEEIRRQFGAELRLVNLDPGYLTAAALVMATAKDFSHRIPLQDGIYAHLEFLIHKNGIQTLPWTYPDLRRSGYGEFFLSARKKYLAQLQS